MFNTYIIIIVTTLIIALIYTAFFYRVQYLKIYRQKKASEVRLGQIAEHLVPYLKHFQYDPKRAHFLGMPVDYIVFDDNAIIFLEIKTGASGLNRTQRNIKKLIDDGKVRWEELRLTSNSMYPKDDQKHSFDLLKRAGVEL
jgi:hypothetical protein